MSRSRVREKGRVSQHVGLLASAVMRPVVLKKYTRVIKFIDIEIEAVVVTIFAITTCSRRAYPMAANLCAATYRCVYLGQKRTDGLVLFPSNNATNETNVKRKYPVRKSTRNWRMGNTLYLRSEEWCECWPLKRSHTLRIGAIRKPPWSQDRCFC
jgi:hypothetical protein